MLLLVGLGNPGPDYARNRHNIGFMAIDAIAERYGFPPFRSRFQGLVSDAPIGSEKVMLLKPTTYMNLSGQAVGEAMRYFKLTPADITVLYDEIDLAFGKLKIKRGGGSAGHNGIKDIDAHLGDPGYRRIRLGVGHPGGKGAVKNHVLSDFGKMDMAHVEKWLSAIADNIAHIIADDDARFLNDLALAMNGDTQKSPAVKKEPPSVATTKADETDTNNPKTGLAAAFEAALSKLGKKPDSGS